MKENGKLYLNKKQVKAIISSTIMMQEHFYALYVFTVQSNSGVATTPHLSTLKIYPTPGEGPIHPVFASKGRPGNY